MLTPFSNNSSTKSTCWYSKADIMAFSSSQAWNKKLVEYNTTSSTNDATVDVSTPRSLRGEIWSVWRVVDVSGETLKVVEGRRRMGRDVEGCGGTATYGKRRWRLWRDADVWGETLNLAERHGRFFKDVVPQCFFKRHRTLTKLGTSITEGCVYCIFPGRTVLVCSSLRDIGR